MAALSILGAISPFLLKFLGFFQTNSNVWNHEQFYVYYAVNKLFLISKILTGKVKEHVP